MKLAWLSLALLLAAGAAETRAHEWYPAECCSGRDCAPISAETVTESRHGYLITVAPGGHPMWPASKAAPLHVDVGYGKARTSPDGKFHLCIGETGNVLCFFAVIGGT